MTQPIGILFDDLGWFLPAWQITAAVGLVAAIVLRPGGLRWRDEDGAASGIGLLATFPAVLLLLGVFVELSFALTARMAVQQAARAAARSALVWESEGEEFASLKARQAAALALVPFASGHDQHRPARVGEAARGFAIEVEEAYRRAGGGAYRSSFMVDRSIQAYEGTSVDIDRDGGRGVLRVRVTYEYPITFGFIGRLVGRRAREGGGFVRPIGAEYVRGLQEAIPDGLDIGYRPAP